MRESISSAPRVNPSLRRAFRFFLTHAGYCAPPGRAACALALARAEQAAADEGLTFDWESDPDGFPSDGLCSCGCGKAIETCEACVCRDADGNALASLCGIWDATDDYRRTVEAELAIEALGEVADRETSLVRSL